MVGKLSEDGVYRVEKVGRQDSEAIVDVLVQSFGGYPWTSWIVPAEGHAERLRVLFDLTVAEVALPYGEVWAVRAPDLDPTVVGAIVVLRPDRLVPPNVRKRMGDVEADVMGERLPAATEAEAACAGLRPADPHLSVATMGVHPDHRRRGVASALLQAVLGLADELGLPIYLETSTEGNVALYRQAGFSVTGRVDIDGGPSVWGMWRVVRGTDEK